MLSGRLGMPGQSSKRRASQRLCQSCAWQYRAVKSLCCGRRLGGACFGNRYGAVPADTRGGALLYCAAQPGRQRGCGCLRPGHADARVAGPAGCRQTGVWTQPEAQALMREFEGWGPGCTAVGCLDISATRLVRHHCGKIIATCHLLSCWLERLPE